MSAPAIPHALSPADVALKGIPPLHWWRMPNLQPLGLAHAGVLKRAINGIYLLGSPDWPKAARGDGAMAIRVAFSIAGRHASPSPVLDLVASALLRCAIEGDRASALVLNHLRRRSGVSTSF